MLNSAMSLQMSRCAANSFKLRRRFSSVGVKVNEGSASTTTSIYSDFIQKRMQEAANSILVQVESDECYSAAYSHCTQFGSIATAIAYKSADDRPFLLMEYSDEGRVMDVLANGGFQADVIPWKNRYFNYRQAADRQPAAAAAATHSVDSPIQRGHLKEPLNKAILQAANSFDDQVRHVYDHLRPNDLQHRLRCLAALQVESVLAHYAQEMFPSAKVLPFGSSFHGFGTFDANLDMTVQFVDRLAPIDSAAPLEFYGKDFDADDEQIEHDGRRIKCIAWLLDYLIPDSSQITPMAKSRPPLARYFDAYVQCRLDVSANNVHGLRETELLYALGELDARVRPFILLVHKWAAAVGLAKVSKGKFQSIQLTYLAIHFLQQLPQPMLPPLQPFYTVHSAECQANAATIDVQPIDFKPTNTDSIGALFRQFLLYYAAFDVNTTVITTRTVEKLAKPVPDTSNAPPPSVVEGKVSRKKSTPVVRPMYMEKIFVPNGNIADNITDIDHSMFLIQIENTLKTLDRSSDKKEVAEFLL